MLDRRQACSERHFNECDQRADASLLHHLLVLLVSRARSSRTAVERVQPRARAATEADDATAGDRLGHRDPFALGVGRDDDLMPERDRPSHERFHGRGLAAAVRTQHDDVRRESAALGRVDVRLPRREVPQCVGVEVDAEDGPAVPEPRVGHERVDACDVLRCRLVRRDPRLREVPVAATHQTRPKRPGNGGLGQATIVSGRPSGLLVLLGAIDLAVEVALLPTAELDGSEGCRVLDHHFIPIPIGSALTMSASACWQ